jgi:CRP-like cAMP-binding protein
MKKVSVIQALRQSSLFGKLKDADLELIAAKAKMRQFFPDETIVWQGDPSDSLYMIINGIVTVKRIISSEKEQILAYLMPGKIFGEVGMLNNQPRSATVAAMSDVDVLVLRKKDFLSILHTYPTVAIELSRLLGKYLIDANRRIARGNKQVKLILLLDIFGSQGATAIGLSLARALAERTGKKTVYTEYPVPQKLVLDLNLSKKSKIYHHPAGYDLLVSHEDNFLPDNALSALMLDDLVGEYENIVMTLNDTLDEDNDGNLDQDIAMMLDYAKQVILLVPPRPEGFQAVEDANRMLRANIRFEETNIFTLFNRSSKEYKNAAPPIPVDFQLPYMQQFSISHHDNTSLPLPKPLTDVFDTLIDRLERTNHIGVYIPTTISVDQPIDTKAYVERTLNFLAERFGGATSKEAQGVWNSDEVGLVGEKVYIVHTYVTQADMSQYLDDVIDFVKILKVELRQEAMALEVNQKLTLI